MILPHTFERRDHVGSKYIIKNKFWPFKIPKKGAKRKIDPKMTLDDL